MAEAVHPQGPVNNVYMAEKVQIWIFFWDCGDGNRNMKAAELPGSLQLCVCHLGSSLFKEPAEVTREGDKRLLC